MPKPVYKDSIGVKSGDGIWFLVAFFFIVPKNLLSWFCGALSRLEFPSPISGWLNRGFAMIFGIDLDESEHPVDSYPSIEAFFTRKLKEGLRPVVGPVCSPADGTLSISGGAVDGMAVQAKGLTYSLAELILGERADPTPPNLDLGWFATIYLAPHNYHRVHVPVSGKLKAVRYLPGELWPVNSLCVPRLPRLFNRNERLVFDFEIENGGRVYAAMVGALNVGRITTPFWPEMVTNALDRQLGARPTAKACDEKVAIGQEMGTFMLGSTVVLAFDRQALKAFSVSAAAGPRPVLMGQSLVTDV